MGRLCQLIWVTKLLWPGGSPLTPNYHEITTAAGAGKTRQPTLPEQSMKALITVGRLTRVAQFKTKSQNSSSTAQILSIFTIVNEIHHYSTAILLLEQKTMQHSLISDRYVAELIKFNLNSDVMSTWIVTSTSMAGLRGIRIATAELEGLCGT